MKTSFCPLVIVEGNFRWTPVAQVGQAETATDLCDPSELADDTRDSATGDSGTRVAPGAARRARPNLNAATLVLPF
jgi:hypothetical protein